MRCDRSPGPRTPEGLLRRSPAGRIRVRDARTTQANDAADARAGSHLRLTLLRVSRVDIALHRCQARLPPVFATRLCGSPPELMRPPANRPPQGARTPGPTAPFKPSRVDPMNREPTAKPGSTVPFKQFRTDPMNREPMAKPGATASFKRSRTDP
jgi:hypothetical protein